MEKSHYFCLIYNYNKNKLNIIMTNKDLKQINFYENRERYAMTQLYLTYLKPSLSVYYDVELHLTPTHKENSCNTYCYDALILLRDKITTHCVYKFIVEIKHRDNDFDTVMLEKVKYNSLMKVNKELSKYLTKDEGVDVLYVNFMPSGTFIYKLTNDKLQDFLKLKVNKVKEKQVKSTFIENDIKIDKDIYYLPKTLAKYYPYIIPRDYELTYMIKTEVVKTSPVNKTYSLFQ
jgi:hypothetical protein